MCSATPDLQLCAFATLIYPLRARDSLGEKNSFCIGGETKSHFRKVASKPPDSAFGSECAAGRVGPAGHGSSLAVLLPEARGNGRERRETFFQLAEFSRAEDVDAWMH